MTKQQTPAAERFIARLAEPALAYAHAVRRYYTEAGARLPIPPDELAPHDAKRLHRQVRALCGAGQTRFAL